MPCTCTGAPGGSVGKSQEASGMSLGYILPIATLLYLKEWSHFCICNHQARGSSDHQVELSKTTVIEAHPNTRCTACMLESLHIQHQLDSSSARERVHYARTLCHAAGLTMQLSRILLTTAIKINSSVALISIISFPYILFISCHDSMALSKPSFDNINCFKRRKAH